MSSIHSRTEAFTLIELLIVVAIISILATIAVPNFLEAQTRAKVSRTQNDLRSVATALEAYRVDNNSYPRTELMVALSRRLMILTAPISYMTQLPTDPFFVKSQAGLAGFEPNYVYASGNIYFGSTVLFNQPSYLGTIYSLAGRGPDGDINFGGYCLAHPAAIRSGAKFLGQYDPTNGTISAGDIVRLSPGTLGAL